MQLTSYWVKIRRRIVFIGWIINRRSFIELNFLFTARPLHTFTYKLPVGSCCALQSVLELLAASCILFYCVRNSPSKLQHWCLGKPSFLSGFSFCPRADRLYLRTQSYSELCDGGGTSSQHPISLVHPGLRTQTNRPHGMKGVGACWVVASFNLTSWKNSRSRDDGSLVCEEGSGHSKWN